jgi:hypothetical protein
MISKTNILTGAMVALMIGGTVAATPAAAWTRYHNNNTGAVVGAAIGGMALGAAIGAAVARTVTMIMVTMPRRRRPRSMVMLRRMATITAIDGVECRLRHRSLQDRRCSYRAVSKSGGSFAFTAGDRKSGRSLKPSQPYENVKGGLLACSTSLG